MEVKLAALAFLLVAGGCSAGTAGNAGTGAPTLAAARSIRETSSLFVLNGSPRRHFQITEYSVQSTNLKRYIYSPTHRDDRPCAFAFNSAGDMAVAYDRLGEVDRYYAPGYWVWGSVDAPGRKDGCAHSALAFDAHGTLYVLNESSIWAVPPKTTKPSLVIAQGVDRPVALAFDQREHLYVANAGNKTVTVYAEGQATPLSIISDGITDPRALAFDKANNLYVANEGRLDKDGNAVGSSVVEYGGGRKGKAPIRTITDGMRLPIAMLFDNHGLLYVLNLRGGPRAAEGQVNMYSPGSSTMLREVHDFIRVPRAMALTPDQSLLVSNAPWSLDPGGFVVKFFYGESEASRLFFTSDMGDPVGLWVRP